MTRVIDANAKKSHERLRRGRRPLRSAETLSAAIEIAIARSALATKLCSVMSVSMRARTRHATYQSCVRGDSVRASTIEVARANALAITRRGGTRWECRVGGVACADGDGWAHVRPGSVCWP